MPRDPSDEELTIRTGGQTLGGWLEFEVRRGVEMLPSSYQISITERYPGQLKQAVVNPGSVAEVYLSENKILTGYIDVYQPTLEAHGHTVTIAGRSKTEDIVDCSVDIEKVTAGTTTWEIKAATIGEAAKRVCAPYGIGVKLPDGDQPLDPKYPFILAVGMSCYDILEDMARSVEMLIWDDENGNLVLSKVGTKRAGNALVEGQNCEVLTARLSMDQRYSRVLVLGQTSIIDGNGPHLSLSKTAPDPLVPRNRLLMLVQDLPGDQGKWLQQRADWEVARRYGRSRQVQITVTGWRDRNDALWQPNTIVSVQCPSLKVGEDMLIVAATWKRGAGGTQTVLTLMPPAGLKPAPFVFNPVIPGLTPGTTKQ